MVAIVFCCLDVLWLIYLILYYWEIKLVSLYKQLHNKYL